MIVKRILALIGIILLLPMLASAATFPAEKRYTYQFTTPSGYTGGPVYVEINTDLNLILSHLQWMEDYNICKLYDYVSFPYTFRIYYYSSANTSKRYKALFEIVDYGTFTSSHCYYPNTLIPKKIRYPKKIRIYLDALDNINGSYSGITHWIEMEYLYPVYIRDSKEFPYSYFEVPKDAIKNPEPYFMGNLSNGYIYYKYIRGGQTGLKLGNRTSLVIPTIVMNAVTIPLDQVSQFSMYRGDTYAYWLMLYKTG